MPAEIIPFQFESSSSSIRVIEIDGEPWFVAKDVTDALEYQRFDTNLIANVPEEWKGTNPIRTPGGLQELWFLSEQGLYFFMGRSDKPKALPFQMWIAGEVLPTLRKRGYYGQLNHVERLRYHGALARTIRLLETCRNALGQNLLLQQVQGICSVLKIDMPVVTLLKQPADEIGLEEKATTDIASTA